MIRLFPSNANVFNTNGLGVLSDALSCTITEELNGIFELEMTYPIHGSHYKDIGNRRIIVVEPNPFTTPQAFRIYKVGRPINGTVTVNAEHISYDLTGYPVHPFSAHTASVALQRLKDMCVIANCPFTFRTDMGSTIGDLVVQQPTSIRSLLAGSDNTILGMYGGEYEFNNYEVYLHGARGSDRGVTIAYGKNMMDLNEEMSTDSVYSHVYPYWFRDEVGLVEVPGFFMSTGLELDVPKIKVVDFSSYLEQPENYQSQTPWSPTSSQLRTACQEWIEDNKEELIIPSSNINVTFVQLAQSEEYQNYAPLQRVHLGDTVKVTYPDLGVDASAKCIKTVYNPIMQKYDSIELGQAQTNLITEVSDSMNGYNDVVDRSKTEMQLAIDKATKLITGGLGGNVILHSSDPNSKYPDEILIMDTDDINTAKKVWRWNSGGLGYSDTGYEGPYALAMTMDGAIVADRITAGELSGDIIRTNSIRPQALSTEFTDGLTQSFAAIDLAQDQIESRVEDNEGNITTITQSIGVIDSRISDAEGEISSITQTVDQIESRVADNTGRYSSLNQTVNSLTATVATKTSQGDVKSIIEMNPDLIRLQSTILEWDSTYSSLEKDGTLTAQDAVLRQALIGYGLEIFSCNASRYSEAYIDFHNSNIPSNVHSIPSSQDYDARLCCENGWIKFKKGGEVSRSTVECGELDCDTFVYQGSMINPSDKRLKKDICDLDLDEAHDIVMNLHPKTFKMRYTHDGPTRHGFVYQDVVDEFGNSDWAFLSKYRRSEDDTEYGALSYVELIADLVGALQYQNQIIKNLEARVDILEKGGFE